MTLATAARDGAPSARMVLLKAFDKRRGFVWYTNVRHSRKAAELSANPRAALVFWWQPLERSVRVEGAVERVSDAEADAYFQSRPRGSRLSACASRQSQLIASREALERQRQQFTERYNGGGGGGEAEEEEEEERERERAAGADVARPSHFGGYLLRPRRIEFWKGRRSRFHDRVVFERRARDDDDHDRDALDTPTTWQVTRLQP